MYLSTSSSLTAFFAIWSLFASSSAHVFAAARRAVPVVSTRRVTDLIKAAHAGELGVRVDGYWFVPWLRSEGVDLAPAALDDRAVRALRDFAALFGGLAATP